jgi:hypothetical protein
MPLALKSDAALANTPLTVDGELTFVTSWFPSVKLKIRAYVCGAASADPAASMNPAIAVPTTSERTMETSVRD